MSRPRWARRIPPVEVGIECGGSVHRVLLRRGRLALADHVLAAEAAAAALGAPPPPCFDVYRSWRAREQWEIALQPRGPGFHQLYRRPPLPKPLLDPLERGIARGWERRADRGDDLSAYVLHRALRAKAEPALSAAFTAAVRRLGGGPTTRLELQIGPPSPASAPASASASASGTITPADSSLLVRVAPSWLRTVGHPRLATDACGRFVVTVEPRPLAIDWQPGGDAGTWHAHLIEG